MRVRVEAEVGEMLSRATSQSQSRWKGDRRHGHHGHHDHNNDHHDADNDCGVSLATQ